MAVAEITTRIANPAKKTRRNVGKRHMTAKQLKYFGTKRQKAAAKANRKRKNRAHHRARSKPRKQNRGTEYAFTRPAPKKHRKRKSGSSRKAKAKANRKRKNTGAIYALVNPAGKKGKHMARKKKNKKSQRHNPAGSKRHYKTKHNRRRNAPGGLPRPMDWVALGVGAVVGGFGATSLPQLVLQGSNTGIMGYLGMAGATAVLAIAEHMLLKNPMLTAGTVAGGTGALIKRLIGDFTPFGQYLNANAGASGMGDYLTNWNFPVPAIIGGNGNTALGAPGQIPVSVAGVGSNAGRALMNV